MPTSREFLFLTAKRQDFSMWTTVLLLLAVSSTAWGLFDCENPSHIECSKSRPDSPGSPTTEEELNALCPSLIRYYDCLGDYARQCPEERTFAVEGQYESIKDLLADICDRDSLLHAALSENIACIGNAMDNTHKDCRAFISSLIEKHERVHAEKHETFTGELTMCGRTLSGVGCFAYIVNSECGSVAKDVVLKMIQRSYVLKNACTQEDKEDLREFINGLNLEQDQHSIAKEIFELKK